MFKNSTLSLQVLIGMKYIKKKIQKLRIYKVCE